jgi:hypothetical protein
MIHRCRNRLTILQLMGLSAVAGGCLGLLAAYRHDADVIAAFMIASLVIVVPTHLAIEGNRRDDHAD